MWMRSSNVCDRSPMETAYPARKLGTSKPSTTPVIEFDHQIHFDVIMGTPVSDSGNVGAPRCLFPRFADSEGLREKTEFGSRSRVERRQFLWSDWWHR